MESGDAALPTAGARRRGGKPVSQRPKVRPVRRESAIGLIGSGYLSEAVGERLLNAGRLLVVLSRDQPSARPLIERGARDVSNAFYLTSAVDTVLLALPDARGVETVLESPEGVLSALAPGQTVINLGTSLPSTDRRLAALVAARGGDMLDAPLALRGEQWVAPVGGSREAFLRAQPLLGLLAQRVAYVGPSGFGQLTKIVDQLIRAAHTAALAEGLAFARRVGLDPHLAADLLDLPGARAMLGGHFDGHGELRQQTRDLGYALEVAQEIGLPAPLTAITNEIFKSVASHSDSSWQETALITYWE